MMLTLVNLLPSSRITRDVDRQLYGVNVVSMLIWPTSLIHTHAHACMHTSGEVFKTHVLSQDVVFWFTAK